MEQLNRIELIGIVGSAKKSLVGEKTVQRLSVATNLAYKTYDGTPVIETTWHNVVACTDDIIEKENKVHIIGRLRRNKHVDNDENIHYDTEVIANKIELISDDSSLLMEIK